MAYLKIKLQVSLLIDISLVPQIIPDASLITAMEERLTLHQLDLADNEAKLEIFRRDFSTVNMDLAIYRAELYYLGYNFQTRTALAIDRETGGVGLLLRVVSSVELLRSAHLHSLHNCGRINKDIRWDIMMLEELMADYKVMIEDADKERLENEAAAIAAAATAAEEGTFCV